jgi:ABC-type transport system substrate-binding protein
MTNEAGFRYRKNIVDYAVDYIPLYRDGKGNFNGISYKLGPSGGGNSAVGRLIFFCHSSGAGFTGFDPEGRGTFKGDPYVDSTLDKAKAEPDENRRKALVQELQRYLAQRMYSLRWPGGATLYRLVWPAVKNFEVYHTVSGADRYLHEWIDDTLPPFRV